jgi:hypothetical protein
MTGSAIGSSISANFAAGLSPKTVADSIVPRGIPSNPVNVFLTIGNKQYANSAMTAVTDPSPTLG